MRKSFSAAARKEVPPLCPQKEKTWSPTRREQDVLEVLWNGEKPMTASEIVGANLI